MSFAVVLVACGPSEDAEEVDGVAGAQTAAGAIESVDHDTAETAFVVEGLDDSFTTTERRDLAFSLPPGETIFFRVHYEDTWDPNGVLNPPEFGLRIDNHDDDPSLELRVAFLCDGKQNGGRAECSFGLANGSSECDWFPDPLARDRFSRDPLLTMSKMSCNTITNASGTFTIEVKRDAAAAGAAPSRGLATLRVRNALDSLNDPSVDQDAR